MWLKENYKTKLEKPLGKCIYLLWFKIDSGFVNLQFRIFEQSDFLLDKQFAIYGHSSGCSNFPLEEHNYW